MSVEKKNIINKIPSYVLRVSDKLLSNGFEAYLVGGGVRDMLRGERPKDYDIATNALPEQIENIFPKSISTGAKFGTVVVVMEDKNGERFDLEVTTYRSESDYYGGRWPGKVEFTKNIRDDLSRRDFTINAIAIDLNNLTSDNIEDKLVDYYDGEIDLADGIIRAVGDPDERFQEDGLRPIRACRFASVLDFEIEKRTYDAIKKNLNITKMVAVERVRDEFNKMIMNSPKPSKGFRLLSETGILDMYIPELTRAKEFEQPEYHTHNVFEHSLRTMDLAEDEIKWAALLHDIGKIDTYSKDRTGTHYYGHDVKGAKMAKDILKRLKFSNAEIQKVSNLIRWHMFYYPSSDWRKEYGEKNFEEEEVRNKKVRHGWSDAAIRRFIKNIGGEENLDNLIKLRIADATSNPRSTFSTKEIDIFEKRVAEVRKEDMALKISDLDISGHDLKEIGYTPGPKYSEILKYLLEIVIDSPTKNNKDQLLQIVKKEFPLK